MDLQTCTCTCGGKRISSTKALIKQPSSIVSSTISIGLLNARSVVNKAGFIRERIIDLDLALLGITETWLSDSDCPVIVELCPAGHTFIGKNRPLFKGRRGGGIGFVVHSEMKTSTQYHDFTTFEAMTVKIRAQTNASVTLVYRPPPSQKNGYTVPAFLKEIEELLVLLSTSSEANIWVIGDFNFHFAKDGDSVSPSFQSLMSMLSLSQTVSSPTHRAGNLLDLVVSNAKERTTDLEVHPYDLSDHALITFKIDLKPEKHKFPPQHARSLRRIDLQSFSNDLTAELLTLPPLPADLNQTILSLNDILSRTLDHHAPLKPSSVRVRQERTGMTMRSTMRGGSAVNWRELTGRLVLKFISKCSVNKAEKW